MNSARELFVHEIGDMLNAEKRILEGLDQFIEESQVPQLRKVFETHRKQTEGQIERLQQVCELLGEEPEEEECKGIEGLIQEKQTFMEQDPSEEIVQLFDFGASAKVEHYEIAAYNSLINLATQMRLNKAVRLLNQNLHEEEQTLKKVEGVAKKFKPENMGMEVEVQEISAPSRGRSRSRQRRAA